MTDIQKMLIDRLDYHFRIIENLMSDNLLSKKELQPIEQRTREFYERVSKKLNKTNGE